MRPSPFVPYPPSGLSVEKVANFAELEALVTAPGWAKHDLGPASDPSMRVFGFSLGDTAERPVVFIEANIHGDHEWPTVHWVRAFMGYLADPSLVGGPVARLFGLLRASFAFYVVPSLNPYGYLNGTYHNANDVNLNRNWPSTGWAEFVHPDKGSSAGSEPEIQAVVSVVQAVQPLLFVDCHNFGNLGDGVYVGGGAVDLRHRPLRDIWHSLTLTLGVGGVVLDHPVPGRPVGRVWGAEQVSKSAPGVLSLTLETGVAQTNIEQGQVGVTALLALCLEVHRQYHGEGRTPLLWRGKRPT